MKKDKNKKIIAICYDFDKTLSPSDSSLDFGYFDKLGITKEQFWHETQTSPTLQKMDNILAYLYYAIYKANKLNVDITKQDFINFGKNAYFYKGVEDWFDRINNYAKKQGYILEHYIISAGLKEVITNTKIAKHFKKIYASTYMYENDKPIWPAFVVNYTNKTQYLFRVKKNILVENDNRVNERMIGKNVRIPFENMIYIGDSVTDIPCMSIMVKNGGTSIGVYENCPAKKELMLKLYKNNRINHYVYADYSEESELEKTVQNTILKIKQKDEKKAKNNDKEF